jgi:glutaredoxin
MRLTLLGGVLAVLLVVLGVSVADHAGSGDGLVAGWLAPVDPAPAAAGREPEARSTQPPAIASTARNAAPATPTAAPPAKPAVLAAGEVSVLEADAPDPMVRYADADGSIHMVRGLARVPAAYRAAAMVVGRGSVNVVDIPAPTAVAFRDWQPGRNPNRSDVVLFSAPWCAACDRAKRHLDERGIRYDERDIDADESARREVVRILGQVAIPLLEVDGRYISGFRPDVYDRALGG